MAEITRFVQEFPSLSGPYQTEPVPGRLYRRGPDPWASWPRQPASAYHCDQRWRGCAGTQVGALRLSALSDAAQAVAVVCPGDVSGGLENRRDGASGAGLLRQVSQRVCVPCGAGCCAVAVLELGDLLSDVC